MTEIQNNLFGIKWPTGVDMPLNKTQTQMFNPSCFLELISDVVPSMEEYCENKTEMNNVISIRLQNIQF